MGTTAAEVREMMRAIGVRVGPREWRGQPLGRAHGRLVPGCGARLLERRGAALNGCRVAIEGFGKVGAALARLLAERGATVVAISTSRGALYQPDGLDVEPAPRSGRRRGQPRRRGGAGTMDRARLLELPVDLLCPCARYHSIHAGNVDRIAGDDDLPRAPTIR